MLVIDLMLALAIVASLGPSLQNTLIAIGLAYVSGWARFVRGNVLTISKPDTDNLMKT